MTRLLVALSLVFGLIVLGYVLRRIRIPRDRFWPLAENGTYYLFLPALLLANLATAEVEIGDAIPDLFGAGRRHAYSGFGFPTCCVRCSM